MIIESADLSLVDEAGRHLLRKAISLKGGQVKVRGLMEDDLYLIQSKGGAAGDVQLLVNLSPLSKYYKSTRIPSRSARFLDKK